MKDRELARICSVSGYEKHSQNQKTAHTCPKKSHPTKLKEAILQILPACHTFHMASWKAFEFHDIISSFVFREIFHIPTF